MVRALSFAALTLIAGCSVDLGIERMLYRCDSDSQCAAPFSCDHLLRVCAETHDAGSVDASVPPCGFDEEFDSIAPEGWAQNDTTPLVGFVQMTRADTNQRSTLWYEQPIYAERFTFEMVFTIFGGGDNGGEGMTMAWVENDSRALGGPNANLGAYGLRGYVVEIDTFSSPSIGDPASEHIAFARTRGERLPDVDQLGVAVGLPPLRGQAERTLRVEFDRGRAEIFLDGALALTASTAEYQPFEAIFGATAATGSRFDSHVVHRLRLECP